MAKTKKSYGVALCKFQGPDDGNIEILLVKKRYTYHFFEFVFGRYKKNDTKNLMYLFNHMTYGEKICILNMKFAEMWYRVWLNNPEKSYFYGYKQIKEGKISIEPTKKINRTPWKGIGCYFKKKNKFESSFMKDSGKRLLNLIDNSSNSETPWDIPKGHKFTNEQDLNAARREFEEETGIDPKNYTALWHVDPILMAYQTQGITYKHYYYLATPENIWNPKVSFKKYNQVLEVECIKWVSKENIKFLSLNADHHKRMMFLFDSISKIYKKNTKKLK
jgi:8-oxo-dGTP pyrophosphatase MutT (NUDIX family)